VEEVLAPALRYLALQQAASGRFTGRTSNKADDFSTALPQPTPFYTSLIVACIRDIPGSEKMIAKAANYLLSQRSPTWSWNYWQRDTAACRRQPYPDDLDDTACALVALHFARPSVIDGSVLAQYARQLIAGETQPGGPYNSWLTDINLSPQWHDVDIAVNANIGYFLALQNATLPGLEQYITTAIHDGAFCSSYYIGEIPSWYFMSRWYRGPARPQLTQLVQQALGHKTWHKRPLMMALLISAACHLDVPPAVIKPAVTCLLLLRSNDHWRAEALYGEPGEQFAGSDALTTAFAVEALHLFNQLRPACQLHKKALTQSWRWPTPRRGCCQAPIYANKCVVVYGG
jgi:hypothetical protein